ncbi:NAD(P)H-dependent oxidoreductase [Terrimonas sp. NA20]|uniref:NAD(P)H-dependent oxidoreductase n=1 Tax=Terrimonas ginsenosidimutans TaxID=2908004 RepID=A0ABS9KUT7_9BACT|nr:NAD(P)H-dependent oxidoreductase [Terrimonas ginsenosidimutans]MCG2616096.1 NAD(P)H-dependent oxidoreductase [Terrimonas ginsenosidimutans]
MKKIFIINGGQHFGHSGGRYNDTVAAETNSFFAGQEGAEIKQTNISEGYDPVEEVEKFVWADVVVYHTPIWWFQLPYGFKKYIDEVFTAGHQKGIYHSDGRRSDNPKINYGTGGMLHGRQYMLTTSWNAPDTAFTLPGEFFNEKSVDEGPLFGFHRMNAFTGMKPLTSFHFHDVEKNADVNRDMAKYRQHLEQHFTAELKELAA